jgi:hypothetical protein
MQHQSFKLDACIDKMHQKIIKSKKRKQHLHLLSLFYFNFSFSFCWWIFQQEQKIRRRRLFFYLKESPASDISMLKSQFELSDALDKLIQANHDL